MDRKEFSILVKALKAIYPEPKFIPDKEAFDIWYDLLNDIPFEVCKAAVYKYMATNKFPPTIADIRQIATEMATTESLNEGEAWALVYRAICNSGYHATEEFNKLPIECQKAVGNPAILREWANLNINEVNTVIQSNFMRSYKVESKRTQEYQQLPQVTKDFIAQLTKTSNIKLLNNNEKDGE